MYASCPKCGADTGGEPECCPACGVVFAKWLKQQLGTTPAARLRQEGESAVAFPRVASMLAGALLYTETRVNPFIFWGRAVVFLAMLTWGWYFLRLDYVADPFAIGKSFMHLPDLVFHEAGHVLFRPFGWFMTILGGSLFQLMVPALLCGLFVFRYRNPFAAALCLWWLGQSSMDLAPYIDDALDQKLVLLGGRTGADAPGNHDWNNILGEFNVLEKHRQYAAAADGCGKLLIVAALFWSSVLLHRQHRHLEP